MTASATPSAPASTAHPTVLVAVLSAAGIGVSLMQTLIVPLIPGTSNPAAHQCIQRVVGHHGDTSHGGRRDARVRPSRRHVRPEADAHRMRGDSDRRIAACGDDEFAAAADRRPRTSGLRHPDHPLGHQRAAIVRACRKGRQRNGFDERITGRRRRAGPSALCGHRAALRLARAVLVGDRTRCRGPGDVRGAGATRPTPDGRQAGSAWRSCCWRAGW